MENLRLEVAEQIALVTIDRPRALNALNSATLRELNDCLRELEQRKDVRVIIAHRRRRKVLRGRARTSPRW